MFPGIDLMPPASEPMQIGDWIADPRDDSLSRGGERVKIEPRTMRLLVRLALTPGVVVSLDELLESVWSGVVVSPASVYQSMSQLRKVLGDTEDPPRYIETVARKGYRLVAPVSVPPARGRLQPTPSAESDAVSRASSPRAAASAGRSRRVAVILATILIAAVLIAVWRFSPRRPPLYDMASIAVLPFTDLTDGHTQQMFCDGLTEETASWLAQVPTLRVVARSSAEVYRDRQEDVRTIGRELRATHVLEGSLRRSGNLLRITVQLIDTTSGFRLWSESYNEEAGNVLHVQEEIARKVANNLELRISSETDGRFADRRSQDGPAQELYLTARAHYNKLESASNELAITLYRQALRADPNFSLAKVYLAQAIGARRYFKSQRIEDLLPEILPLLAEVEKSAPSLVDLYVVRGNIYVELGRRELAERDFKRALDLDPSSLGAASLLAKYSIVGGQPRDALSYYTIAAALDPKNANWQSYRCLALTDLAQFDEAERACEQARALGPNSAWAYSASSNLAGARGRMDEALRFSAASLERDDVIAEHAERARWLNALGLMDESAAAFREAVAANPEAAARSSTLIHTGITAAVATRGATGLQALIDEFKLAQSDDPAMLFEIANAWATAGDFKQARTFVDRALSSTRFNAEDLESAWLARSGRSFLIISAVELRANGETAAAEQRLAQLEKLLARLEDAGVRTAGLFELKAQLAAMRGRGDDAIAALKKAVAYGWNSEWQAMHEPYFAALRDREDFRQLLGEVSTRNAETAAKLKERPSLPAKAAS